MSAQEPGYAESDVEIDVDSVSLPGTLVLPKNAKAVVIFAHGSGSSRHSPRNTYVADVLHAVGFGTLLFDLLTTGEDEVYENRFNIDLLAERLAGATEWLQEQAVTQNLKLAYFGASTGAAAALQASVKFPDTKATVSRGGRPDLAWNYLDQVRAPTLLIVGGRDQEVIELNSLALERLKAKEKELLIVPGATHLFEEPGTLEEVATAARDWFVRFVR